MTSSDRFRGRGGGAIARDGRSRARRTLWLLLCLAASGAAQAGDCTVSTSPLVFGSYDPLAGAPVHANGSVRVACRVTSIWLEPLWGVAVTVALGTGGSGSYASRSMAGPPGSTLNYNLYTTSNYSSVWGNGSGGTQTQSAGIGGLWGESSPHTFTVFGRIPAGQDPTVGLYSDSIIVTVTF